MSDPYLEGIMARNAFEKGVEAAEEDKAENHHGYLWGDGTTHDEPEMPQRAHPAAKVAELPKNKELPVPTKEQYARAYAEWVRNFTEWKREFEAWQAKHGSK